MEMKKYVEIKDYDLDTYGSMMENCTFRGINIGSAHYMINEDDILSVFNLNHNEERAIRGRGGLIIPRRVFKLEKYDWETKTVKAREITLASEKSLVGRIALEFHMLGF